MTSAINKKKQRQKELINQFAAEKMADLRIRSDQWDIRMNVPNDVVLTGLVESMGDYFKSGKVRYSHVSGVEVGDVPGRTSYGEKHVHIALVLYNYTSRGAIIKKIVAKSPYGWYVSARDKTKSLHGWIDYHGKNRTKLAPEEPFIFMKGDLPEGKRLVQSEEDPKKKKKFEDWERKKYLMQSLNWSGLDKEFPGFIYSSMGQAMKRDIMKQSNDQFTQPLEGELQNFIIWGDSGTGKSSSVALLYPECYKKQKGSQYWDGYDKTNADHAVVWIDEMSKETLKCITGKMDGGFEFLKELADRYPVTVDEKYTKGFKIRPKSIIVTMNEHPTSLLPDRAVEVNKKALYRKFKVLHVADWLALNGLICTSSGCIEDPNVDEYAN